MRKKILLVVLLFGMVLSLTDCSGNNSIDKKEDKDATVSMEEQEKVPADESENAVEAVPKADEVATVTIEGNKYVLTGDIQEVIGSMVKDGLDVEDHHSLSYEYDENGKHVQRDNNKKRFIMADELFGSVETNWIYKEIIIDGSKYDFESKLGITSNSRKADMEVMKGFISCEPFIEKGAASYWSIYIDGEYVDFAEYEEDYLDFVKVVEESGYEAALMKYLPVNNVHFMAGKGDAILLNELYSLKNIDEIKDRIHKYETPFKETVIFNMAISDVMQKITTGEIDTYSIICYEFTETKGVFMKYIQYYHDENYDMNRFK